jgi:carbon-monoxide dehydrogenase small subunit
MTADRHPVTLQVNGEARPLVVESRRTLADVLRDDLGLTGTHVGCEHGVCGACTVALDGAAVRACLVLAVQADGATIETVEGLAQGDRLHPVQQGMWDSHAFQCAFCAPGVLMTAKCLLERCPAPSRQEIRAELAGNLCRCTGYTSILDGVEAAAAFLGAVSSEASDA